MNKHFGSSLDYLFEELGELGEVRLLTQKKVLENRMQEMNSRLDEFANLERGWFDDESLPFDKTGLEWVRAILGEVIQETSGKEAYIYPTPMGEVRVEWPSSAVEVDAVFKLDSRTIYLIRYSPSTDDAEDQNVSCDGNEVNSILSFLKANP